MPVACFSNEKIIFLQNMQKDLKMVDFKGLKEFKSHLIDRRIVSWKWL